MNPKKCANFHHVYLKLTKTLICHIENGNTLRISNITAFAFQLTNTYLNEACFLVKETDHNPTSSIFYPVSCPFVTEKVVFCHTHLKVILTYKNEFNGYREKYTTTIKCAESIPVIISVMSVIRSSY